MAEILHFEILRKHGQTDRQTDMGITIPRPPPMGGEVTISLQQRTCTCIAVCYLIDISESHRTCRYRSTSYLDAILF